QAELVPAPRGEVRASFTDTTVAPPIHSRPLEFGFAVCCHSATKYLNGHSDIVAGCVVGSAELVERIRHKLNHFGGSLDPHAGFLLARGIKTLALRVAAHNANATRLAEFLAHHPAVREVNYRGLPSPPDHALALELR